MRNGSLGMVMIVELVPAGVKRPRPFSAGNDEPPAVQPGGSHGFVGWVEALRNSPRPSGGFNSASTHPTWHSPSATRRRLRRSQRPHPPTRAYAACGRGGGPGARRRNSPERPLNGDPWSAASAVQCESCESNPNVDQQKPHSSLVRNSEPGGTADTNLRPASLHPPLARPPPAG